MPLPADCFHGYITDVGGARVQLAKDAPHALIMPVFAEAPGVWKLTWRVVDQLRIAKRVEPPLHERDDRGRLAHKEVAPDELRRAQNRRVVQDTEVLKRVRLGPLPLSLRAYRHCCHVKLRPRSNALKSTPILQILVPGALQRQPGVKIHESLVLCEALKRVKHDEWLPRPVAPAAVGMLQELRNGVIAGHVPDGVFVVLDDA